MACTRHLYHTVLNRGAGRVEKRSDGPPPVTPPIKDKAFHTYDSYDSIYINGTWEGGHDGATLYKEPNGLLDIISDAQSFTPPSPNSKGIFYAGGNLPTRISPPTETHPPVYPAPVMWE
eukprot:GHVO01056775.1.p1 GENE.GHVO01056775.1~~GHVO01056775.1.p1  ORF type:complete len:119 (+),score=30.45 GHVO01056775.1:80-436(+)